MIERDTVLVLGAGASYPYGFPLGGALRGEAVEAIRHRREDLSIGPTIAESFCEACLGSGQPSIDAFLEKNTDLMHIGKLGIAATLLRYEANHHPASTFKGGWYELLFQNMMCGQFHEFGHNRVRIATFNYDRSLEHTLMTYMRYTFRRTPEQCAEELCKIPIVHLYGSLGGYKDLADQWVEYGNTGASSIRAAAEQIALIPEDRDDLGTFDLVRDWMEDAENIFLMGFGWDRRNLDRLGLMGRGDRPLRLRNTKVISGTCFGLEEDELRWLRHDLSPFAVELIPLDCQTYIRRHYSRFCVARTNQ